MSNEEKVNEIAIKMLAGAYHQIGYRKGVYDAVFWGSVVLTAPFIYLAVKDHIIKKRQEKTEK